MLALNHLVAVFLVLFATRHIIAYIRARKALPACLPLRHNPIHAISPLGGLLPRSSFYRSLNFIWDEKFESYKNAPLKTYSMVSFVHGPPVIYTSSVAAIRQAVGLGSDFGKSYKSLKFLSFLGQNIVGSEGDVWKRHRRITAPAFNHTTYKNVWNTTTRVYADMIDKEGWKNMNETPITNFNKISHKLALFIIAIVGFGLPMRWLEPYRDEEGRLSVQAMVFGVAGAIFERAQLPNWCYKLGIKSLNEIDEAYTTFDSFMAQQISQREAELTKARSIGSTEVAENIKDVFGRLVDARLSDGKLTLSDQEIIGNCFVFTFAGHETTANTLSATIGLLGAFPEAQQWVYDSIKKTLGDREPTFEDFDSLEGVLACFYEGLRLYPAAYVMTREAYKDTVLDVPYRDDPSIIEHIPVKKGTHLVLDIAGMCYDPQVFTNPTSFEPWRWGKSIRASKSENLTTKATKADEVSDAFAANTLDGFLAFSYGPRTCLGHKFAKIEAVAFLTFLLLDWKIEIDLLPGETGEQWRDRVLRPYAKATLTIPDVPVKLVRRVRV